MSFISIRKSTKKTIQGALLVCLLFLGLTGIAQNERANRWAFPTFNGMDFSSGVGVPVTDSLTGRNGTSSISDENGNMVFYSNGETVWQANGAVMQGGTGLVGDDEATQSSIIVPSVLSSTRYYLFTNDANTGPDGFQYYDVEMTLNGGNGGVVGPTSLLDTATEKVCATRHGNDRDYWVVAHRWESDHFAAFLVDINGVNITPVISAVGQPHLNSAGAGEETGQMKISPDGSWIATCNFSSGYVQLFRFNNETGQVSDPITLASGNAIKPFGLAFSADSKKLYYAQRTSNFSDPAEIRQFDLDHASVDCLLASEVAFSNNNPFKLYSDMQLGIDKNIYICFEKPNPFFADTLGIIDEAWKMCPDCEYTDNALLMNHTLRRGLPNFVSSFLSDGITYEFGTNCDQDTTWFTPEDTLALDSVRWNFGDPTSGANNTSTLINAPHVFTSPDTFLVTLFSYRGNDVDTFERNVIVWDTAVDLLGSDTTLCLSQSITFEADWYNSCLLWSDNTTGTSYTTSDEGWHWVEVSYQSCVWRDSVFLTVVNDVPEFTLGNDTSVCSDVNFVIDPDLQNAFYTWQNGSHDTTFTVTSTGQYWLQASNACGSATDTLNVILNEAAQPVLEFPADTTVCDSVGLFLDVTFEDAVYEWSDGLNTPTRLIEEPGVYWVRVGNACDTVSDTIEVMMDSPIIPILPDREVYCGVGDNLVLLATADSQTVDWSVGPNASTLTVPSANTYWFTAENSCGFNTDTVEVLEWDSNYVLNAGNDSVLCPTDSFIDIGELRDDYPWTFAWNTGEDVAIIFASGGTYILEASHRCATLSDTVVLQVSRTVFIEEPIERNVCQGETLTLELTNPFVEQVLWSTEDTSITLDVTEPGLYDVNVTDSAGCGFFDSIQIGDVCPGLVNAFNVFTPNGDGLNDELCAELENIVSFSFAIHNRWGTEVFFSEDETKCWDGEVNGREAMQGVYYYIIEAEDATGETFSFRGSVTLLR